MGGRRSVLSSTLRAASFRHIPTESGKLSLLCMGFLFPGETATRYRWYTHRCPNTSDFRLGHPLSAAKERLPGHTVDSLDEPRDALASTWEYCCDDMSKATVFLSVVGGENQVNLRSGGGGVLTFVSLYCDWNRRPASRSRNSSTRALSIGCSPRVTTVHGVPMANSLSVTTLAVSRTGTANTSRFGCVSVIRLGSGT